MGECRFDNYDACPCGCGKCLCVECIGEASRLAVVALIHERDGLRADLAAARADVERLRAFVRDSAYVVANVRTGDNRCGSCHALIHMCELADPKCRGAAARALLAETAPKGPHADT